MEIAERSGLAVLYPSGYLNGATGQQIEQACHDLVRRGYDQILINFGRVDTINTTGIGNLVSVLENVGRRNGVVCFSNLLAPNRQVLDVLDISNAVLIFDEEEQAIQHFARQR
ncbi:MAG TPA: STAS domain-containing protein [Candidatus Sumerlaeota bacterium]|nr:STAS domain-containing protein [Candidatus Sumerlaeota bacterium]HPS02586.1 STAS domain-containing protein [Candidatus Sumerlaeota bacterium]